MTSTMQSAGDELDLVGQRLLERYRVDERIARGGMSTVYRGWDERLRRPVCIKLFREFDGAESYRPTVRRQFVREAYTLSQLNHPHTLRIYDFGRLEATGAPFQVSELAEGGTLRDHIRNHGPVAIEQAVALLEPIIGALSEAHERGIIHRDIKPSNVLLSRAGPSPLVKLADFGIATAPGREDETQLAHDAEPAMYSLNWAAPEQLHSGPVGPATDVFSLALVAAFVMTGRVVFAGDDVQALFAQRSAGDTVIAARIEALGLPPATTAVLLAACSSDPTQRTPTPDAFLRQLRDALDSDPGAPTLPVSWEPPTSATDSVGPVITLAEPLPETCDLGGRTAYVVALDTAIDLEWRAGDHTMRLRARRLEIGGLHLKGLDCFLSRPRGRPSSGVSIVDGDVTLNLLCAGQQELGLVRVRLGITSDAARFFRVGHATLRIPLAAASWSVVLDGTEDEPALILVRRAHEESLVDG